jgi:hypothetical protein
VFVIDSRLIARRKIIQIGHRNSDAAEVLSGLAENDRVIIFPSDQVVDGVQLKLKAKD